MVKVRLVIQKNYAKNNNAHLKDYDLQKKELGYPHCWFCRSRISTQNLFDKLKDPIWNDTMSLSIGSILFLHIGSLAAV